MIDQATKVRLRLAQTCSVEDVTSNPEGLRIAVGIAARRYVALSSRSLDVKAVQAELFDDVYHANGSSRTLLLSGYHPRSAAVEPLATLRVSFGADAKGLTPPLEMMALLTPEGGWADFAFADFAADSAVELGRLAIEPSLAQTQDAAVSLNALIVRRLLEYTYRLGVNRNPACLFWAVMSGRVTRLVKLAGISLLPAPHITLNRDHAALFNTYDRYWSQGEPWLYNVTLPR